MNISCWLGLHSKQIRQTWYPSFCAVYVEALETAVTCSACGKRIAHEIIHIDQDK